MTLGVSLVFAFSVKNPYGPSGAVGLARFFYFYIFCFRFLQKYIFDLEIYRNIPRPPGSRAVGAYPQKKEKKIADRSLGTGRPAAGRPAPHAARLRGGRPPSSI